MDWVLGSLSPSQAELLLSQESKGRRQRPSGRKSAVSCSQCGPVPSLNLPGPISPLKQGTGLENFPALKRLSEADEGQASRPCCLDLRPREPSPVPGGRSTSAASAPGPGLGAALAPASLKPGIGLRLFPATRRSDASPGPDCSDLSLPQPPRLLGHLTK